MTNENKSRSRASSLFVVFKKPFVVLGVLLLLHGSIDYVSSFSPALHEVYSSLPLTNLDFPREAVIVLAIKDLFFKKLLALSF